MLETSPKSKKARRPRPAGFFHSAVASVSQNASPMPVPMPTAAAPPPPTAAPTPVPTATAPPPPQQSSQSQHPPDETAAAAAVPTAAAPPPPPATAAPVPAPTAATSAKLRVLPRKVRDATRSACANRFMLMLLSERVNLTTVNLRLSTPPAVANAALDREAECVLPSSLRA